MLAEDIMKPLNPGRYSTEELNRFMNYLDLMLEMGKVTLETAKLTFDQIHQMASFSSRDPREEARLYPRIVCFTLKTVGEAFSPEIWATMIREAIMYLRKTADCYDMPSLLELLCETAYYNNDPEEERHKNWYKAICIAFDQGQFPVRFNRYDAHDSHNQLYLIHEFLKRNRLVMKELIGRDFTQEELSHSIMDPVNYSRIESGVVRPRAVNYKKLARKMGISSETYQGEITTSYLSDFQLLADIRHAVNTGDITALKEGLSVLNDHLDRDIIVNAQILDQFQVNLDLLEGRINEEQSISKWTEVLNYTVPYEPDEKRIYSDLEINIIYKIIRSKRRLRIMTDQDIRILEAVLNSEKKSQITSWERTGMLQRLHAGIMQTQGEVVKSEEEAVQCLREMIKAQSAHLMADCLDILAEDIMVERPEEAEELMQATYWICDLYQNTGNRDSMAKIISRFFDVPVRSL